MVLNMWAGDPASAHMHLQPLMRMDGATSEWRGEQAVSERPGTNYLQQKHVVAQNSKD